MPMSFQVSNMLLLSGKGQAMAVLPAFVEPE